MLEGCVQMGMLPRTSSPFMRPCLLIPFLSDLSLSLSLSVDTDIHGINMDGFMRCPCGSIPFFLFNFFFLFFSWKHLCCCIALCSISTAFGTCLQFEYRGHPRHGLVELELLCKLHQREHCTRDWRCTGVHGS